MSWEREQTLLKGAMIVLSCLLLIVISIKLDSIIAEKEQQIEDLEQQNRLLLDENWNLKQYLMQMEQQNE